MPTYEYICSAGHAFEAFQKISERPKTKCPNCGKAATRKISGGAGLVFKGSGFYITDYGKDGKGARKEKVEATAPAAESSTPKSEAKVESKKESGKESKQESKKESREEPKKESKQTTKSKAST